MRYAGLYMAYGKGVFDALSYTFDHCQGGIFLQNARELKVAKVFSHLPVLYLDFRRVGHFG